MGSPLFTSAGIAHLPDVIRPKRRHYRHKVHILAYVNLNQGNGGIIREISEAGLAVQAVAPLRVNQEVQLRFELLSPRTRVEASGRVVWADSLGQAGLEFIELPQRGRRLLKEWLFTQLLTRACQACGTDSVFLHTRPGEEATELLFSGPPRPALALEAFAEEREVPRERVRLMWCPVPVSVRVLSRLLDGLILASAVLLFSVVSLGITHVFPAWPIGVVLLLAVASIFAAVYWWMFASRVGVTPGEYLARLAGADAGGKPEKEERPRFR